MYIVEGRLRTEAGVHVHAVVGNSFALVADELTVRPR